ncbi:YciI family protein [Paracoccus versutus]|uniref:YciI family protein n=1 Tax=Paracoccus versutus TaxID=34007 RepID=UPI000DF7CB1B|nr:YciI family protein [Paracoccus versutus]RDD69846.1 YciI family protein [Paracoccus versutus]
MLYSIHCLDGGDRQALRAQHFQAHQDYLKAATVRLVVAGPLLADDGETAIGSMFVIEAPDRATAEAFNQGDPFYKAGVWGTISLNLFKKRWDDRLGSGSHDGAAS